MELETAALQFPLHHPLVAAVIPGADRPAIVHENLRLLQAPIPDTFWAELKAARLLHPAAPLPG